MATHNASRVYLLATARLITSELRLQSKGAGVRLITPNAVFSTNTDGWCVTIGSMGKSKPRLEIWFDKFTKGLDRKLYACFRAKDKSQIEAITKRVSAKLWGIKILDSDDLIENSFVALGKRLPRADFDLPVLETYENGPSRYGIYDPTSKILGKVNRTFVTRVVAFYLDVLSTLRPKRIHDSAVTIYPRVENRSRVISHIKRERSQYLATECKIRDNHVCQICDFSFEATYGKLGLEFAEAHHIVPLSKLAGNVLTRLTDLVTVCSNCHRMLHRMDGKPTDVIALRKVLRKPRQKRLTT